jgi:hypothetical protein
MEKGDIGSEKAIGRSEKEARREGEKSATGREGEKRRSLRTKEKKG